jgi:NTE family protein
MINRKWLSVCLSTAASVSCCQAGFSLDATLRAHRQLSPSLVVGVEPSNTIEPPPTPPVGKPAVEQETEDRKQQMESSAPAKAQLEELPANGKVLVSPSEKRAAAMEAVTVLSHGPQPKISAVTPSGRPTVCLALGGGGARGAAHIGVIRELEKNGIPIDYIVGNSMGAAVGGLYASGIPLEKITEVVENGDFKHAYMPMVPPKMMVAPIEILLNPLHKQYAGLYSGKKFTRWLDEQFPVKGMNVQDTKIPFSAVATNLLDGRAYRLSEGRLSTVIKASCALSPILKPVPIGDNVYVDGGVRANLPAKAARETGAGIVIAVLVDEPITEVPAKKFMHLHNIASRMIDIVLATADERQLQYADVVINPNVSNIGILSAKRKNIDRAIEAGVLATQKAMPAILKQLKRTPESLAAGQHASPQ